MHGFHVPFPPSPKPVSEVVRDEVLGIEGLVVLRNLGEEAPGTSRVYLPLWTLYTIFMGAHTR